MGEANRRALFDETWGSSSKAPSAKTKDIIYHLNHLLEEDEFLWIKIGSTTFYLIYRKPNGKYEVHPSIGSGLERQVLLQSLSLETFVNLCETRDGGGFFVSGVNAPLPKKEMMGTSRVIKTEIDGIPFDKQAEAYRQLMGEVGFDPILLTSGGESLHFQQPLEKPIPVARQTYYERLLCLLVGGDPAVAQPQQPVRLAGVLRRGKGLQELIAEGIPISEDRLIGSFDRAFEDRGWEKPLEIPDDWWHELKPVIGMPVIIREKLAKGYLKWKEEQQFGRRRTGGKLFDGADYRVPLSFCCSQRVRDLLQTGTPKGQHRYDDLKTVQREVFPVQNYLISIGQPFDENAEQLVYDFGRLSGMSEREVSRYMFGDKENKPVANGTDRIDVRIQMWARKEEFIPRVAQRDPVVAKGYAAHLLARGAVIDRQFERFRNNLTEKLSWIAMKHVNVGQSYDQFKKVIMIPQGDQQARLEAYKTIDGKDYRFGIDCSTVGSGKSRAAGMTTNTIFISNKDYQNPTTESLEHNFTPMPPRSAYGQFRINGRLVNDPAEELRKGLEPENEANCPFAVVAPMVFGKNYDEAFTKGESGICGHCPMFHDCQRDGFRKKKRIIEGFMAAGGNVRAHSSQLFPVADKINDPGSPGHGKSIIVDEAGEVEFTKTIHVTSVAMKDSLMRLMKVSGDEVFLMTLGKLISRLNELATDPKEFKEMADFYGIDEDHLGAFIGECPDFIREKMSEFITELTPDPSEFLEKFTPEEGERDDAYTREVEAKGLAQQMYDRMKELSVNWLPTFLKVWSGDYRGSFHMDINGTLVITHLEYDLHELANANHGGIILLDATARPEDLCKMYGIPPEETVIIKEEVPDMSNLTVSVFNIPGLGSYSWSPDAINRTNLIIEKLLGYFPDMEVITLKRNKEKIGAKYHFGLHNRGTNLFKDKKALCLVGTPWMNLGVARRNYRILYGSLKGFERYYDHLVKQEMIQAYGRTRAQHTDEQKHLIIITTGMDFDYLADEFKCEIENMDLAEFCPEALKGIEKVWHTAKEVAKGIILAGEKLTQLAIANKVGVTQSYVSRAINEFGGSWKEFKILVQNLVNNLKYGAVEPESEEDTLHQMLENATEEVIEEMYNGYHQYGFDWLVEDLSVIGYSVQSLTELIWLMVPWFDENVQRMSWEIFDMFDSC